MRFIGNKENILDFLHDSIDKSGIKSGVFCDFFSGTSNVGRFYKEKGFKIISSDILYFSYVLQYAYLKNNKEPSFKNLLKSINGGSTRLLSSPLDKVLNYLDSIEEVEGFIYKNYTSDITRNQNHKRMYFIPENGKRIDAIRLKIEEFKNNSLINEQEYYVLLASLIETVPYYANISGVYAAFLKAYDPRALKKLKLRPIKVYRSGNSHSVYNKNSMDLLNNLNVDILYIDPPYNNRQYAPNYHLLETIALYDSPQIKGVTGLRDYTNQRSDFCNKNKAILALDEIASTAKFKCLALSYNSEGIMPEKEIRDILSKYGKLELIEFDYKRFKSNSNGMLRHKKHVKEQVYLLTK